jgi:ribosomal protein L5
MARLLDRYHKEIVPKLKTKLGRENALSLPRLQKIVVNMGVGKALQDKNRMEQAAEQLTSICGQRVQITKARIAVSAFRLRQGNEIGCRVTLRGKRMYEFLDRLVSVALPRIRDFRGVNPKSFDGRQRQLLDRLDRATRVPGDRSRQGELHARHGHHLRHQHARGRRSPRAAQAVRDAVP